MKTETQETQENKNEIYFDYTNATEQERADFLQKQKEELIDDLNTTFFKEDTSCIFIGVDAEGDLTVQGILNMNSSDFADVLMMIAGKDQKIKKAIIEAAARLSFRSAISNIDTILEAILKKVSDPEPDNQEPANNGSDREPKEKEMQEQE